MVQNDNVLKSYISQQARNLRYLLIIDSTLSAEALLEILYRVQMYWGGRYTPVIPSYNGLISQQYVEFASFFDPDYVVYTPQTNISLIKHLFNPCKYVELKNNVFPNFKGIDRTYLLNFSNNACLLVENYLYKSLPKLYAFYKLNFDFHSLEGYDYGHEKIRAYKQIIVDRHNQNELNKIMVYDNVEFAVLLARKNVMVPLLDNKAVRPSCLELVIARDDEQLEDLLYYWNRVFYSDQLPYNRRSIYCIYITLFQLEEFLKDEYAFQLLNMLSASRGKIDVSSRTIPAEELNQIIQSKMSVNIQNIKFNIVDKRDFPFKVERVFGNPDYDEKVYDQTIIGAKDLLRLPDLTFVDKGKLYGQNWVVDCVTKTSKVDQKNEIRLPVSTNHNIVYPGHPGRVTKTHEASLIVGSVNSVVNIEVPPGSEIIKTLLVNEESVEKKITKIGISTDGLRLSALLKLFQNDLDAVSDLIKDKFWLGIFGNKSINKQDERIKNSKGVVSLKDLNAEFFSILKHIRSSFNKEEDVKKISPIKEMLITLVQKKIYFAGYKILCNNCGSKHWYSLTDTKNEQMNCKGCYGEIDLLPESEMYYKLNDVVKNCLVSESGSKNNTHGNLTVLYTLIWKYRNSSDSFYYLPPHNYYYSDPQNPRSDIDIVCVSDGRLCIGEAKNSVEKFENKVVDQLIELGNEIKPDEIILSFNEGDIAKLDKAIRRIEKELRYKNCRVIAHKVDKAIYQPFISQL